MKILVIGLVSTVVLWSVTATVKYADVKVEINGTVQTHEVNKTFEFDVNQTICLLSSGDGQVAIVNALGEEEVLSSSYNCTLIQKAIPFIKKSIYNLLASWISRSFSDAYEITKGGLGSKGSDIEVYTQDMLLSKIEDEYIYIEAHPKWTLPLELEILGKDTEPIKIEFKDGGFLIPKHILKKGQNIEIKGNFSGLVLDVKVRD